MDYLHISPSFVTRIPYLDVNKKHYIQRWFQANDIINTRIHASVTLQFYLKNWFNKNELLVSSDITVPRTSINKHRTRTTRKAPPKIGITLSFRPLISGFDFALLEVRNLCVASRLQDEWQVFTTPETHLPKIPLERITLFLFFGL
jgi:hypothetical protein